MKLAIEIFGWWVLFNCAVVPCLTWAFFRFDREERDADEPHPVKTQRDEPVVVYSDNWRFDKA